MPNKIDDSAFLVEISHEATWEIRHQVLWPKKPLDYVKLPSDPDGYHYGIQVDKRLVSVISLFVEGESARFRKFATLPNEQGKGYGSRLLRHVIQRANTLGAKRIWCNARLKSTHFYKRFDMEEKGKGFKRGNIPYVVMERLLY